MAFKIRVLCSGPLAVSSSGLQPFLYLVQSTSTVKKRKTTSLKRNFNSATTKSSSITTTTTTTQARPTNATFGGSQVYGWRVQVAFPSNLMRQPKHLITSHIGWECREYKGAVKLKSWSKSGSHSLKHRLSILLLVSVVASTMGTTWKVEGRNSDRVLSIAGSRLWCTSTRYMSALSSDYNWQVQIQTTISPGVKLNMDLFPLEDSGNVEDADKIDFLWWLQRAVRFWPTLCCAKTFCMHALTLFECKIQSAGVWSKAGSTYPLGYYR